MPANLVKFVYAPSATAEQIAAFDANTIYFIGSGANGGKLYKGTTLYDAGSTAAASELAQLKTYIGTLPVSAEYTDLIDYIDQNIAAAQSAAEAKTDTLEDALAAVAKSGAAADVSVADAAGKLDATNVEAALAEIVSMVESGGEAGAVTVEKTTGGASDTFAARYTIKQGGSAVTGGVIDISKDMVATNGELVNQDGEGNPGTFIRMTIANGQPFYINVADLIEYNAVSSNDEITLTDTNHTISATVGEIAASKIVYRAADTSDPEHPVAKQTVAQAINALETAASTGVDDKISAAIAGLDSDIDATSGSVITGITIVDGELDSVDEVALTAQNVAYGSSNVKAALDTIGAIPATATATTVVGYVDEKTGAGINALNADLDAALGAGDTDVEAVAVMSGVTQTNGALASVDSVAVDAAGAATRAKAAVIGASGDATTANTIYGAKAYADAAVTAALADVATDIANLDADLDASGTAQHSGVFVVSGVTQVDGVLTAVDSTEVEVAGAAAAAEAAAKTYTDTVLTWGTLS